jgi:NitT/TauT family transport system substrate-binding protein
MLKLFRPLCLALSLAAIASQARAETITLAIGVDAAFVPFYVAAQRGLFTKAGLDVKLLRFSQGGEAMDAVIAGQAQLAGAADQTAIIRLARADLKPLAIYEESGTYIKAVVRAGIAEPKQIKKLGIVKGTVSEYSASRLLEKFGLTREQVAFVPSGAPEFPALLARGDIDAFFAWEPWPAIGVKSGGKILMTSGDVGYAYAMWLTASGPWLKAHDAEARAIMNVLAEADRAITADPAAAAADLQAQTKLPSADTLPLIKDTTFKVRDFTEADAKSYDGIATFLAAQKITPAKVDVNAYLQHGFYRE